MSLRCRVRSARLQQEVCQRKKIEAMRDETSLYHTAFIEAGAG